MLRKIFICLVCSMLFMPVVVSAYDGGYVYQSIGDDNNFYSYSSHFDIQQSVGPSYNEEIIKDINQSDDVVKNDYYQKQNSSNDLAPKPLYIYTNDPSNIPNIIDNPNRKIIIRPASEASCNCANQKKYTKGTLTNFRTIDQF